MRVLAHEIAFMSKWPAYSIGWHLDKIRWYQSYLRFYRKKLAAVTADSNVSLSLKWAYRDCVTGAESSLKNHFVQVATLRKKANLGIK
jgi:hypothetical protein